MPMSDAARAAASERMKAMLAKKRAAKLPDGDIYKDKQAIQEALARQPMTAAPPVADVTAAPPAPPVFHASRVSAINIDVDWDNLPMPEAQTFYAHLRAEFEKAGKVLNARSNAHFSGYDCFMCKKHFNGNPGFTDYSYRDPATGLSPRVDCCGELCVINYHKFRIDMRLAENVRRGAEERGE